MQVYCPTLECGAILQAEAEGIAECYQCGAVFCTNCSKPYHGNSDCNLDDTERKGLLENYLGELEAEKWFEEESRNQLAIEEIERGNEEWLKRMREEQIEIKRLEQIFNEEEEKSVEEERRLLEEENRRRMEEEVRIEQERIVQQNLERERQERAKAEFKRREEMASEEEVRRASKPCPRCRVPIQVGLL